MHLACQMFLLARMLCPRTNILPVLWVLNHKYSMLGVEQNLILSPKQAALFSLADAVWFTWLGLLIIWRRSKLLSKSSDSFFSSNKIHKRFRHDPNNLHLKYSCPSPSPEMTFKLCLGNLLWANCHGPLRRVSKTGREREILRPVFHLRDLRGSKWNSLLLSDLAPWERKHCPNQVNKVLCVSKGCGEWN